MGKASFAHVQDGEGRLQVYLRQDDLGPDAYELFRRDLDLGDVVEISGYLFRTKTGEITGTRHGAATTGEGAATAARKVARSQRPGTALPPALSRPAEQREARKTFVLRTRIVSAMRRYLDGQGFLEVETPVLQPLYGGATAKPFVTHHNTLDTDLYLRISDELYLKRLIMGGFDRVYEIGRDFRNEGIDTSHLPEFTMMECYAAYWDYADVMRLVEQHDLDHRAGSVWEHADRARRTDDRPDAAVDSASRCARRSWNEVDLDILQFPDMADARR